MIFQQLIRGSPLMRAAVTRCLTENAPAGRAANLSPRWGEVDPKRNSQTGRSLENAAKGARHVLCYLRFMAQQDRLFTVLVVAAGIRSTALIIVALFSF
jgi:hypothetical protein